MKYTATRKIHTRVRMVSRRHGVAVPGVLFVLGLVRKDASVLYDPAQLKRRLAVVRDAPTADRQQALWRACKRLSVFIDGLEKEAQTA